ncbi:MAG: iron ABC transporter permease [Actinomycetaceae bacterium]|nr:iron ABC transporter permease [Actinomycetaceae bacterium]
MEKPKIGLDEGDAKIAASELEKRADDVNVVIKKKSWRAIMLVALAILLLAMSIVTVAMGAYDISVTEVWRVITINLFGGDVSSIDKLYQTVIWEIRAPRVVLVILVGAALATSGAVYQGAFRNPLVEPFILGVSAGASLGAALAMVYPNLLFSAELGAFIFAMASVALAYFLARVDGQTPTVTLVLAGLVISSVFQAFVSLLKYVSDDQALRAITFWTMGGFSFASWESVAQLSIPIIVGVLVLWSLGWKLNVLSMGDDEARTLGINPEILKLILIVTATLITAIAVSATGIISWIGLMMPHAIRMMIGPDNRFVIPGAALLAGVFLLICDTLARTLINAEIPISIITSMLGAPYIFYLLRSKGRLGIGA